MKEYTTENAATFAEVQGILNSAVDAWEQHRGRPPNLSVHGTNFGWETREQLLASTARGNRLIPARSDRRRGCLGGQSGAGVD